MADAAYEGVFYSFESKAQFDALVAKVKAKCDSTEDGCEIWQGWAAIGDSDTRPKYKGNGSSYDLRRLIFQAAFPEASLPQTTFTLVCSCKNPRCLKPEHLQVKSHEWNVDTIRARLDAGRTRAPPTLGFDVGCLIWNRCTSPEGYGIINVDRSSRFTHTIALLLHQGIQTPPKGPDGLPLMVRHKCVNRHCCEPAHLEWGTAKENGEDRVRDGTSLAGENSPLAQMSTETASAIKMSWRPRGDPEYLTQAQRALKFGVRECVVNNIDVGGSWNHLPGPSNKPVTAKAPKVKITRDDLTEEIIKELISRIRKKVTVTPGLSKDKSITSPCHIWTGSISQGYGNMKYKNLGIRPHIIVCEHNKRERTPEGQVVRHICGRKDCVSPDHLTFGTRPDNWVDSVLHGDIKHKFTIEDIRRIRLIPITDNEAIRKEAEDNNVAYGYIQGIIRKRIWAAIE